MCQWLTVWILSTFFALSSTLPPGISIDIEKGVIFEQRGYYSEKIRQQVFHIFIPFNNLCPETPNSDVCLYARSIDDSIKEIGTIMSDTTGIESIEDRKSIRDITKKDLGRVLKSHEVEKFLRATRSMLYYIDDHFYPILPLENTAVKTSSPSSDVDDQTIAFRSPSPLSVLIEQATRKKIGYDFLTNNQMAELFSLLVSNSSQSMDIIAGGEYKDTLIDMIIGQSIFIMKSCSVHDQPSASLTSSCLAISTLFCNLPIESASHCKKKVDTGTEKPF